MNCKHCRAAFNNMEIGRSHEAACPKNPANKDVTKFGLYLKAQQYRFRGERWANGQGIERKKCFIDEIAKHVDFKKIASALCVGAADTVEMKLIRMAGVKNAYAIDLNSHHPAIKKMDMHKMSFEDNTFSFIIASHSLEHSYNYNSAIQEIFRILKPGGYFACEVPVNYKTNDVDRHDFKNSGSLIDKIFVATFGIIPIKVLSEINLAVGEPGNFCGTDVTKIIIQVNKLEE